MPSREAAPDPRASHEVIAVLDDLTEAKSLIEDLEKEGIPPAAISLVDPSEHPRTEEDPNRRIGATVGRSVLFGMVAGLLVGGLAGLAVDAWTDLGTSRVWAVALGAIFGAAIGVAAGGDAPGQVRVPRMAGDSADRRAGPARRRRAPHRRVGGRLRRGRHGRSPSAATPSAGSLSRASRRAP